MTVDHHPDLKGELERIEATGGSVVNGRWGLSMWIGAFNYFLYSFG
jgi:hypothetical protein